MIDIDQSTSEVLARINEIGERLEYRRGWMSEAARELGISRSYVHRLCNGKRKGTRMWPSTAEKIRAFTQADRGKRTHLLDAAISLLEASKPTEALAVLKMLRSSR